MTRHWQPLASAGRWRRDTGVLELTPEVFDAMIANFDGPIPIVLEPVLADAPALGWIVQLEKRVLQGAVELWALVEDIAPPYLRISPAWQQSERASDARLISGSPTLEPWLEPVDRCGKALDGATCDLAPGHPGVHRAGRREWPA